MKNKVICAYVAQRNTRETDLMRRVPHTVKYLEDGVKKAMNVVAECPMDASDIVYKILKTREKENKND